MKAFWWFEDNSIAGMARPGFNCTRWFEFPFQEAVLVGWIGRFSSGSTKLSDFQDHVLDYGSKIRKFYELDADEAHRLLAVFETRSGTLGVLKRISETSQLLESYDVTEERLCFELNSSRLGWEIGYLKDQGITKLISLTENHHHREMLQQHFDTVHFSINDLNPPNLEQVHQFADVLREAKKNREKLAVHCLAGIGRTSTMLVTAHLVMGEKLENLKALMARRNPFFIFAGKQGDFIQAVSERCQGTG